MAMPENVLNMTVDQYLAGEEVALDTRHEFIDGDVYAMTGATAAHNLIVGNLNALIRSHIKGSGCRVYVNDMKVKIAKLNCFYYPDVVVSCDPFNPNAVFTTEPVFICEVLSKSTALIDKREKKQAYKQINSLIYYLIVNPENREAILNQRIKADGWVLNTFTNSEEFVLNQFPNGALTVNLDSVYEESGA